MMILYRACAAASRDCQDPLTVWDRAYPTATSAQTSPGQNTVNTLVKWLRTVVQGGAVLLLLSVGMGVNVLA